MVVNSSSSSVCTQEAQYYNAAPLFGIKNKSPEGLDSYFLHIFQCCMNNFRPYCTMPDIVHHAWPCCTILYTMLDHAALYIIPYPTILYNLCHVWPTGPPCLCVQLASAMLCLFDPTLEPEPEPPQDLLKLIPMYRSPKIQGGVLPGQAGLHTCHKVYICFTYIMVQVTFFIRLKTRL